jgi:hypothetical protein
MDRERITILCLVVFMIFGGAIAFLPVNTESLASVIETTPGDGAQSQVESAAANQYLKVPVGNIIITPPEDVSGKRKPVDFPHSRHFSYACQTCHHKWMGGANLQGCSTQDCHGQVTRPERPGRKVPDPDYDISYFKKAYHQQCITCHKSLKQQNLEAELSLEQIEGKLPVVGPTSCVKCHPEEKE